ncbi:adenosylcobinamide amidohydrolase [Sutcliffiella rhizosphaerae]|uniref:Vitamin B12 import ATP-binding protein BtuD n=1 Tax=Sutcliffiella rhizosphaerae TaxID=2880967 RepID=A0ABM8YJW8_9BACI|nr:adenosylcobinamide amidohydrolase [Sutcliffiella rhizosphaerae]CAG9620234.1 Vitamin B12 import ATP-binding protein BtuD [Sutcliffiella rhizosphaerae]
MIKIQGLVGGYSSEKPIINGIDLHIEKGEFFALLGPNGSGKTTLFKLVTGQLPVLEGELLLTNHPISYYSKLEKAKKVAVLTQEIQISFDYTVEEIISLGRYPHQTGFLKSLSTKDKTIMREVMQLTNTEKYKDKQFRNLSGGEKQRVLLAKALTQEPEILLLDEPTNHLDIKHTFQMLDLIKEWQRTRSLTVFAILHDLNIASLYADRLALLHGGKFLEVGDSETLRKEEQLAKVYEVLIKAESHPVVPKPQLLMTPGNVEKEKVVAFSENFSFYQDEEYVHIKSSAPLRTISNGVVGEGIKWHKHFCNFHVSKTYHCNDPINDIQQWLTERSIPHEQTVGMMTAVQLSDVVVQKEKIEDLELMAVVTAGVGNAVDITKTALKQIPVTIGTINIMLFIHAHLTDGALVNGLLSAVEAKTKAMHDLQIMDPQTNTLATGTSTDAMVLAVTQHGEPTPYAGSGTLIGKGIGHIVYKAVTEAILTYQKRVGLNA